jgi:LCP family protein required for cell wall assembly
MEQREFTKAELRRNAAIVVAIIAAFSCFLILGVRHLDAIARLAPNYAPEQEQAEEGPVMVADGDKCPDEAIYVLVIGSDTRQGTALYTGKTGENAHDDHADIMTLLRVDPQAHTITLVTIPRDTMLQGADAKINDTLLGDHPERTVDAVERLTGVTVDYYMMTTFMTFEQLIDAMDGVEVDVPKTISFADPITAQKVTVEKGERQHVDGAEALVLARVRKAYGEDGDMTRQQNVRNLEMAIMQKAMEDPSCIAPVLNDLGRYVKTDMDAETMLAIAAEFTSHKDDVVFYECYGPYDGDLDEQGVWRIEEDMRAWSALMDVVDAGEDPSTALQEYYEDARSSNSSSDGGGTAPQDGKDQEEDGEADDVDSPDAGAGSA